MLLSAFATPCRHQAPVKANAERQEMEMGASILFHHEEEIALELIATTPH